MKTRYPNRHLLHQGDQRDHRLEGLLLAYLRQGTHKRGPLRGQVGCSKLLLVEVQVVLLVLVVLAEHQGLEGQGERLVIGFEQFNLSSLLWLD